MSAGGSAPGRREVAHRLFAAEFDDADFSYSESDEERAPNYVVTPTGARINRLFVVGVLTETEPVNEEMLRARIVDPTGAFVTYAGQYQPEALAFLERVDPPAFLAVTGKARTFQPEDSDRVYTSIRPESISEVDAETRDRWVVQAAQRTIERVETMAAAIDSGLSGDALREALETDGVDPSLAAGIPLALDHYGTTPDYLAAVREVAEDALAMVAGDVDEVGSLDVAPNEGAGDASTLADRELVAGAGGGETATETDAELGTPSEEPGAAETSVSEPEPEPTASEAASEAETESESVSGSEPADTPEAEPEPATETEPEPSDEPADTQADSTVAADAEPADTDEGTEVDETDDIGDFEPDEEFEPDDEVLTDEEREEAEELGGFSTGNEVEEPGEADIETPDTEPEPATGAEVESEAEPESEPELESESTDTAEAEADATDEPAAEVDLDEAVMDAMTELDDGDGAPHDAIVDAVVDRTGATPDEVEDAIQDALMSGRCYEPDDDVFKPI